MRVHVLTRLNRVLCAGRVKVLAIQCRACGRWVNPHDWHPRYAMCDSCAALVKRGRCVRRHRAGVNSWGS